MHVVRILEEMSVVDVAVNAADDLHLLEILRSVFILIAADRLLGLALLLANGPTEVDNLLPVPDWQSGALLDVRFCREIKNLNFCFKSVRIQYIAMDSIMLKL